LPLEVGRIRAVLLEAIESEIRRWEDGRLTVWAGFWKLLSRSSQ